MFKRLFFRIIRLFLPEQDAYALKKAYGLPTALDLTVRLSSDGWFVVTSPALPGFVTQARSQEELVEMVNDAVLTYFDVPKRKADIVYDQLKLGDQTIQYRGELVTKPAC